MKMTKLFLDAVFSGLLIGVCISSVQMAWLQGLLEIKGVPVDGPAILMSTAGVSGIVAFSLCLHAVHIIKGGKRDGKF